MKRSLLGRLVVVVMVLMVAWLAYAYRVRIEAWIWHLRHGTSITVGDCVIPVPANWYVDDLGGGTYLFARLDTDDRTPQTRIKQHTGILLLPEKPMKERDITRLLAIEKNFETKRGTIGLPQRTFSVGDGSIYCMNVKTPESSGIYDIEPVSWQCKSTVGLELVLGATDPDMNQMWEIVSHIHKKS